MKVFGILFIVVSLIAGLVGWYNVNGNGILVSSYETLLTEMTEKEIKDFGRAKPERLAELEKVKEERIQLRNIAFGLSAVLFLGGISCISAASSKTASNSAKQPPILPVKQDIKTKLAKLAELRDAQLITAEDFELQKAALLENFVRK